MLHISDEKDGYKSRTTTYPDRIWMAVNSVYNNSIIWTLERHISDITLVEM